jgi:hypothetical protein
VGLNARELKLCATAPDAPKIDRNGRRIGTTREKEDRLARAGADEMLLWSLSAAAI